MGFVKHLNRGPGGAASTGVTVSWSKENDRKNPSIRLALRPDVTEMLEWDTSVRVIVMFGTDEDRSKIQVVRAKEGEEGSLALTVVNKTSKRSSLYIQTTVTMSIIRNLFPRHVARINPWYDVDTDSLLVDLSRRVDGSPTVVTGV